MLREHVFAIGGALTIALGVAFVAALFVVGAGPDYFTYWITPAWLFAFGGFFLWVGYSAQSARRQGLRELEANSEPSGSAPPVS
jgi:hypothetical protein